MHEQKPPSGNSPQSFRLGRVLLILIPVVLLAVGVVAGAFFDLPRLAASLFRPALAEAKGQVYLNGELLDGGEIETRHEKSGVKGAMGFIEKDGSFKLQTDVDGRYKDGAFVGRHKVTVRKNMRLENAGPFAPPLATPEKYASYDTSGLVLDVTRDNAKNVFKLELTGEPPARPGPPPMQQQQQAPADPAAAAQQVLDESDTDKDGKLSVAELQGVRGPLARGIPNADTNKDGFADLDEIKAMAEQVLGASQDTSPPQ